MCGIVGVAGTLGKTEEDAFQDLLVIDSIRGEDSTGAAFISRQNDVDVVKTVGDPYQLIDTVRYTACTRRANKCIIGHNRSATVGKVVRKNAHPFEFFNLVGVHNGTLTNKYVLKDSHQFDTDSEALYSNISRFGVENVVPDVNGAYTLVWYHIQDNTINFLRNKERPLFYAFTADEKAVFWASEIWMLLGAMHRRGIKPKEVLELPIDTHFSLTIPLVGAVFDKPKTQQVVQKEVFTQGTAACGKGTTSTTTNLPATTSKKGTVTQLPPPGSTLKGKQTIIRAVSWEKNANGAYHVNAISHEYPTKKFKIYAHSEEECQEVFKIKRWNAVIGGFDSSGMNTFKINILSLSHVDEEPAVVVPKVHQFKADHQGRMLDRADFEKRYKVCCFCGDPIDFVQQWKALSNDACLCEVCLSDKEVADYLPSLF